METELERLKSQLSSRYLGTAGIHALGMRETGNVICVYLAPGSTERYKGILAGLEKEASPFRVLFFEEGVPRSSS